MIKKDNCLKGPSDQPFKGLKLATVSLGCSKNRIDTEGILGSLCSLGMSLTNDARNADLVMVNTCSFIESAQEESINTLLKLKNETKDNQPIIFAAGCLVETIGPKMIQIIPEINGAIGAHSYQHIEQFITILLKKRKVVIKKKADNNYNEMTKRFLTSAVHSVNIKIAEGCSNCCNYCLIPQIRGPYRSRKPQDIINEIILFLNNGAREVSLIAQDTTAYGSDNHDLPDLAGLVNEILKIDHYFWLRIMYTYPSRITDQLINLIANEKRICNYLDIPIQHASSKVLFSMGRYYDQEELECLISVLRSKIPDLTLRTTCMVGYPGEGPREFSNLLSFIRKQSFEHLGAFTYSCQKGTTSASMKVSVPARVITKRYHQLLLEQQQISLCKNRKRVGKREMMLIEQALYGKNHYYYGRTVKEAPEVDGNILIYSKTTLKSGDLVEAKIIAAQPYTLIAVYLHTLKIFSPAEVN